MRNIYWMWKINQKKLHFLSLPLSKNYVLLFTNQCGFHYWFIVYILICVPGNWTQGLVHARQPFYHWAKPQPLSSQYVAQSGLRSITYLSLVSIGIVRIYYHRWLFERKENIQCEQCTAVDLTLWISASTGYDWRWQLTGRLLDYTWSLTAEMAVGVMVPRPVGSPSVAYQVGTRACVPQLPSCGVGQMPTWAQLSAKHTRTLPFFLPPSLLPHSLGEQQCTFLSWRDRMAYQVVPVLRDSYGVGEMAQHLRTVADLTECLVQLSYT